MGDSIRCFMVERRDGQFVRVETDEVLCDTVWLLPVGAMWLRNHGALLPLDDPDPRPMPHLAVVTPAGLWCIDCPSSDDHSYWRRIGTPPNVSVTPSVNINEEEWHGWLTSGRLIR